MEKEKSSLKTISLVMLIMLMGKMLGFLRDILMGQYLGQADAFILASRIPREFLDFMFSSAISASFIPVFNSYLQNKSKEAAFRLANNFITLILILSGIITLLAIVFSGGIVGIFGYGLDADTLSLSKELLIIMLPTIIITGIAFSITGILQSLDEFIVPAAMSVVSNIIIIIYYIFFLDKFSLHGLAVAFLVGWSTQILIQLPSLRNKGFRFKLLVDLKDSGIKEIGSYILPVLVSSWVMPINNLVNTAAVSIREGRISALTYANSLFSVITGVLVLSITNVIFPKLSKQISGNDSDAFSKTLTQTISAMMYLLIPMTLGLFTISEPLVKLFFERGEFTQMMTSLTGSSLSVLSFGMIGFGLQNLLSRGFYASKNPIIPMITGIVAIVINVALSFMLADKLDIIGVSIAQVASLTATSLCMLYFMHIKHKIISRNLVFLIGKMTVAAIVMMIVVNVMTSVFVLPITILVGVMVYLILTVALRAHPKL